MNQRERLLAPFHGVKPDRPAWLADLSYWHAAMKEMGLNYNGHLLTTKDIEKTNK